MKMVMAVIPTNTAEDVLDALVNKGYTATYAQTQGGMLRQSQYSLFIVVNTENLDEVLNIIKGNCRTQIQMKTKATDLEDSISTPPVMADLGGAIAFVWDIDQVKTF